MKLRINAWVRRWVGNDWQHFVEGDIVEDDTEWGARLLRLGAATVAPGSDKASSGASDSVSSPPVVETSGDSGSEDSGLAPQPEVVPGGDSKRPLMTASIAVWRDYAAKLGIKTTGMKKDEIIGAVNEYESRL